MLQPRTFNVSHESGIDTRPYNVRLALSAANSRVSRFRSRNHAPAANSASSTYCRSHSGFHRSTQL